MAETRTAADSGSRTTDRIGRYRALRRATESLCAPLSAEDCVVQSMPDVSPTKWHLAHVTWFFETFVVKPHRSGYRSRSSEFEYLFNSYYNSVGEQYPRPRRGLLTRPTLDEVLEYRAEIDDEVAALLREPDALSADLLAVIELGLHHEQQHQELLLMDVKHVLSCNPLHPAYRDSARSSNGPEPVPQEWIPYPGGLVSIGHDGSGFCFDNERPAHRTYLEPFDLAARTVTNAEYLEFVRAGGYSDPSHWLADGWSTVGGEGWWAPLYWVDRDGDWYEFTLSGLHPLDLGAPVCHVSFYEADAFASWAGARLPVEAEWEIVAREQPLEGNFADDALFHPRPTGAPSGRPAGMFGDCWEWTRSPYSPYPGFSAPPGALGEYNGKFMCNQFVLRGGACVTPRSHIRSTYRNFFYPRCRWQFSGIRLARDHANRA